MAQKLDMARITSQHARINYNKLGKIAKQVNDLRGTFYSKSRARLTQARLLHNCKQRHGWIEHNLIYKTSLLIMLKRGMDHSISTRIHGIKILTGERLRISLSHCSAVIFMPCIHVATVRSMLLLSMFNKDDLDIWLCSIHPCPCLQLWSALACLNLALLLL